MIVRLSKIALVAAVALFYSLVVFNNLADYEANEQFVHHVLQMDTIFSGNLNLWRAVGSRSLQTLFYWAIISWESAAMVLTWIGVVQLTLAVRQSYGAFNHAKRFSVAALTLGLLLWFIGFLTVGGEWFLMWQSRSWNGQEEAFRMFASIGVVLILLLLPETETQP